VIAIECVTTLKIFSHSVCLKKTNYSQYYIDLPVSLVVPPSMVVLYTNSQTKQEIAFFSTKTEVWFSSKNFIYVLKDKRVKLKPRTRVKRKRESAEEKEDFEKFIKENIGEIEKTLNDFVSFIVQTTFLHE